MQERDLADRSILEIYYQLGKVSSHSGIKPIEAIQEIIKSDPEKQAVFLEGAAEGQRLKEEEEFQGK